MKIKFWSARTLKAALLAAAVGAGLAACGTGFDETKNKTGDTKITLPALAEREAITKDEILGAYKGMIDVSMSGKVQGTLTEMPKVEKFASGTTGFTVKRTEYPFMPVDIGYSFSEITLTENMADKTVKFTGENGEARSFARGVQDAGSAWSHNTKIEGSFCKKDGKIYVTYRVDFSTDDLKKAFKVPGDHNNLFCQMDAGVMTAKAK
ncbi:MAG: hypothetical protein ACTTKL_01815 [Treponema sp.]